MGHVALIVVIVLASFTAVCASGFGRRLLKVEAVVHSNGEELPRVVKVTRSGDVSACRCDNAQQAM
jgi:hypothetical protein